MRPVHSPLVIARVRLARRRQATGFAPSAEIPHTVLTAHHESVASIFNPGAERQPARSQTADANGIPEAFLRSWRER